MFDEVTQGGDGEGDAARMPAIGRVEAAFLLHRSRDWCGHQGCAHSAKATGDCFRHAHDVRLQIEVFAREEFSGTAKAGCYLIGDKQGAVFFAETSQTLHEARVRNQDAKVNADRLHDEGCNVTLF